MRFHPISGPALKARSALLKGTPSADSDGDRKQPPRSGHRSAGDRGGCEGVKSTGLKARDFIAWGEAPGQTRSCVCGPKARVRFSTVPRAPLVRPRRMSEHRTKRDYFLVSQASPKTMPGSFGLAWGFSPRKICNLGRSFSPRSFALPPATGPGLPFRSPQESSCGDGFS